MILINFLQILINRFKHNKINCSKKYKIPNKIWIIFKIHNKIKIKIYQNKIKSKIRISYSSNNRFKVKYKVIKLKNNKIQAILNSSNKLNRIN